MCMYVHSFTTEIPTPSYLHISHHRNPLVGKGKVDEKVGHSPRMLAKWFDDVVIIWENVGFTRVCLIVQNFKKTLRP